MAGVGQSGSGGAGLNSQSGAGVGVEYIFKCTTDDSSAPPQQTCQGRDSFQLAGLTIAWELTGLGGVNGCRPEGKMAQDGRRSLRPLSWRITKTMPPERTALTSSMFISEHAA